MQMFDRFFSAASHFEKQSKILHLDIVNCSHFSPIRTDIKKVPFAGLIPIKNTSTYSS
jgi:hypothetical protein